MSATFALQETIFNRLKNDTQLSSKISKIYDAFPENDVPKFPYVSLGEAYSNPFVVYGRMGEEVFMTVHVWSRYKGFKEGHRIVADIQRLLAQQHIEVSGYGNVACFFESSDTIREDDGITRHLTVRYRFLIQY